MWELEWTSPKMNEKLRKEVFSLPDVQYRIKEVNGSKYRVPVLEPDSEMKSLRNWKSPSVSKRPSNTRYEEYDEPAYQICGIENPLAGVYDDDEYNEDLSDSRIDFKDGVWTYYYELSHHHHRHVFGKDLHRIKSLEKSAACTIKIVNTDTIMIKAKSKAAVLHVGMYISERSKSSKLPFTHFVCFPLTSSEGLLKTIRTVQSNVKDAKMRNSAIDPRKLHFTVCLMNLVKPKDMEEAKAVLSSLGGTVNRKICVELVGVQSVQEDSRKSRVVFTGGRGGDNSWRKDLQDVAQRLISRLQKQGLVDISKQRHLISSSHEVNFHATLFNSKYSFGRESQDDSESEDEPDREHDHFFDAAAFVERYKDMILGSVNVEEIRLCSLVGDARGSQENDGFYKTELAVKL